MVTAEDVRWLALTLPRTTEHLIRDRVKFKVKQYVYVTFSHDETLMGFAFPREERPALVESEPDKFLMPKQGDLRYNWGGRPSRRDRPRRDDRAGHRRVADGRPEVGGRRAPG